mmetsp:Transcript_145380/g.465798  ORF Transcript_145380/g.465798 Transcript_145380/m.465798 type:complete len:226 (-) Transcript_145380:174-851(-)
MYVLRDLHGDDGAAREMSGRQRARHDGRRAEREPGHGGDEDGGGGEGAHEDAPCQDASCCVGRRLLHGRGRLLVQHALHNRPHALCRARRARGGAGDVLVGQATQRQCSFFAEEEAADDEEEPPEPSEELPPPSEELLEDSFFLLFFFFFFFLALLVASFFFCLALSFFAFFFSSFFCFSSFLALAFDFSSASVSKLSSVGKGTFAPLLLSAGCTSLSYIFRNVS